MADTSLFGTTLFGLTETGPVEGLVGPVADAVEVEETTLLLSEDFANAMRLEVTPATGAGITSSIGDLGELERASSGRSSLSTLILEFPRPVTSSFFSDARVVTCRLLCCCVDARFVCFVC